MANSFNPLPIRQVPAVRDPKAYTWIGFSFYITDATHEYICGPWPYPGGYRHGQIYDRRDVPGWVPLPPQFSQEVEAMLYRVSDNQPVQVKSLSFSIDWDSWSWSFSAEVLGKDALSLVKPTSDGPVEVEARINGWKFRAIVQRWNDQYSFNSKSYSISGRSPIATLDTPYALSSAHELSSDTSARQKVEEILSPHGYSVTWEVDDWLMKATAFSICATPIRVVQYITEAIGAFILPDPEQKLVYIRPRHKHKSWHWGGQSPDKVLQPNLTLSLSGEYIPPQDVNAVLVQGQKPGAVGVKVVRAGTAGDRLLPEVTHDLITDTTAALQRGIQELSQAIGPFRRNTIATVLTTKGQPGPGLILPGDFIEFFIDGISHKGAVAGTTISANWTDKGLTVSQSLEVISTVGG